ncbi:MAG: transposase, partial [Acidobacteria bacterium]|nr:transposase [Acidobacteriota bacterium]
MRILPAILHYIDMPDSRRRLPHHYPQGQWLFLTWHLHGSLPHALYPPAHQLSDGNSFVWMDRYLDTTREGPLYLRRSEVAQILVESWRRGGELGHYELRAYVVMANHVHVRLLPRVAAARLLQSLKGATAREANRLLGRTGESFWQRESYDHWVRDGGELQRIVAYIENNPVKAGLVARAQDYAWSSAGKGKAGGAETSLGAARK